jgi:hypothetical protein
MSGSQVSSHDVHPYTDRPVSPRSERLVRTIEYFQDFPNPDEDVDVSDASSSQFSLVPPSIAATSASASVPSRTPAMAPIAAPIAPPPAHVHWSSQDARFQRQAPEAPVSILRRPSSSTTTRHATSDATPTEHNETGNRLNLGDTPHAQLSPAFANMMNLHDE